MVGPKFQDVWQRTTERVKSSAHCLDVKNINPDVNFCEDTEGGSDLRFQGLAKLAEYEHWIEKIQEVEKKRLTWVQKCIIRDFKQQCVAWIVGLDIYEQSPQFFNDAVGVVAPNIGTAVDAVRRFGKTYVTITHITAYGLTAVSSITAILSCVIRTAGVLLSGVKDLLKKLDIKMEVCNQFEVRVRIRNDPRVWRSYSASINSGKGMEATLVVLEEGARIPPQTVLQVVVPLIGVRHVPFIYISTPLGKGNWYNKWLETKHNGRPVFTRRKYSLVCEVCIEREQIFECQHKQYMLPQWKTQQRQELMKVLMTSARDDFATENLGIVPDDDDRCFDDDSIDVLLSDEATLPPTESIKPVLYIGVDPAEAGKSEMAIVSLSITASRKFVVLAMDARTLGSNTEVKAQKLIADHITVLEKECHVNFATMRISSIVENNGHDFAAESIIRALDHEFKKRGRSIRHIRWKDGGFSDADASRAGVWLNNRVKGQMIENMSAYLRKRMFYFSPFFATTYRPGKTQTDNEHNKQRAITDMRYKLTLQLRSYREHTNTEKTMENVYLPFRKTFSGKSWQGNDDLATIMFETCYHIDRDITEGSAY